MFSPFFIDRPIFAAVHLASSSCIAGLAAMRDAADRAVPGDRAAGRHRAGDLPGASAEVIEQTVAAPLENAINGVPDMIYMSSTVERRTASCRSRSRSTSARDVDEAAVNVNNRVKQVEAAPAAEEVRRQGVTRRERQLVAFLQVLAFYSPDGRYDDLFISNYVTLNVLDAAEARCRARPTCRSSARRTTRCGSGSSPTASRS